MPSNNCTISLSLHSDRSILMAKDCIIIKEMVLLFDKKSSLLPNGSTVKHFDNYFIMLQPFEDITAVVFNKDAHGNILKYFRTKKYQTSIIDYY